jgi:ferrous iron transport protein A
MRAPDDLCTNDLCTLVELKTGDTAEVVSIEGGAGLSSRLYSMGIFPGQTLQKAGGMAFGGPVLVNVGSSQLAVGRGMAEKIIVRIAKGR